MKHFLISLIFIVSTNSLKSQILEEDFEENTNLEWFGDNCLINTSFDNPFINAQNTSLKVVRYQDYGEDYANIGINTELPIDFSSSTTFSLKIYVPSSGITGNQNNQVSLKLQNRAQPQPWQTQSEIIKPISLNQWQIITFDFLNDNFINLNPTSAPPTLRNDFNRILIQVNGENNNDQVVAYIDNFYFDGGEIPNYTELIWSDEFESDGAVNSSKWFHQTQLPNGFSWYNNEIQHYTNRIENSFVEDGFLNIVAKREPFFNQGVLKQFTSARLNSKFAFTYGKVEVRAKLPTGIGTWPAIWTLGKNINEPGGYWTTQGFNTTGWPACGEMDIMEHWGDNQNYVTSATHTPSSFGATINHGGQTINTASTEFHIYTLHWFPNKLIFSVNNVAHFIYEPSVFNAETWPFFEDQYFLLNIAIQPIIEQSFTESSMLIDYIRVYQEPSVTTSINEFTKKELASVFPNPTENYCTINVNETLVGSTFTLYNMQGQLLENINLNSTNTKVNLEKYGNGIYFLRQQESNTVLKLIKM